MKKHFYSNGKLLLTGEYVVLDGALSLAVPTKYGQELTVETTDAPTFEWTSLKHDGEVWIHVTFTLEQLQSSDSTFELETENTLFKLLRAAKKLNPEFLNSKQGFKVETKLDFPNDWGLGSSSTLVNNIAQWAGVNPYKLLQLSFKGSGYDIACAQHNTAIYYQLKNGLPIVKELAFDPTFKDQLFFIHLNKKQNSRDGISAYKSRSFDTANVCEQISNLTKQLAACTQLDTFESLLNQHEAIIAKVIGITTVKTRLFNDYFGAIKSLGAWGGDFVLATGNKNTPTYFKEKGYETIIPFSKIIL